LHQWNVNDDNNDDARITLLSLFIKITEDLLSSVFDHDSIPDE